MTRESLQAHLQQYHQKVSALLHEVSAFSLEKLNARPADGGWSALQTMQHLILVEELSLRYVKKKMSGPITVERPGLGAWVRNILLQVYLRTPFKFKAPSATLPENLSETATLEGVTARWLAILADWGHFLGQMPAEYLDKAVYKHPRAGRLGWAQTIDFFEAHLERHKKQISDALK